MLRGCCVALAIVALIVGALVWGVVNEIQGSNAQEAKAKAEAQTPQGRELMAKVAALQDGDLVLLRENGVVVVGQVSRWKEDVRVRTARDSYVANPEWVSETLAFARKIAGSPIRYGDSSDQDFAATVHRMFNEEAAEAAEARARQEEAARHYVAPHI
jgi:hypothetical protein